MHHRLIAVTVVFLTTLLAGCDLQQRFANAEDRINTEMPLHIDLRQSRERLLEQLANQPSDRATFDKTWAIRLRSRALSCSPDFTPSWRHSRGDIQTAVKDKACFTEVDRKLLRWIGLQRVRLALALPPLGGPGTVTSAPIASSFQDMGVQLARDAGQAPVLALQSGNSFELVALDDGRSLFKEQGQATELSVAPNGRLFAQSASGALRVRMSEGGETLLELQDARGITWLGKELLGIRSNAERGSKPMYLIGLQRGEEVPLPLENIASRAVLLPVPGIENRFNSLSYQGAYQFEYAEDAGSSKITLVTSKPGMKAALGMLDAVQLSSNGQEWVFSNRRLYRLDPKSLEIQETTFEPVIVTSATASPEPEQFVIGLAMHARASSAPSRNGNYLFDARKGTLARLEGPAAQAPIRYLPAVKRFAQMQYPTIQLVTSLQTAEPEPAERVIAAMIDEANQLTLAQAAATVERQHSESIAAVAPDAPLAALMRDANVEGVGVYEAKEKTIQTSPIRGMGKVRLSVRKSNRPLVLVLSSYEPVQWDLRMEPGARLAAVLLSSYHDASVQGAGSARVLKIGNTITYKQGDEGFQALQGQVRRWTGKPISVFQGEYAGSSFSVGGP